MLKQPGAKVCRKVALKEQGWNLSYNIVYVFCKIKYYEEFVKMSSNKAYHMEYTPHIWIYNAKSVKVMWLSSSILPFETFIEE